MAKGKKGAKTARKTKATATKKAVEEEAKPVEEPGGEAVEGIDEMVEEVAAVGAEPKSTEGSATYQSQAETDDPAGEDSETNGPADAQTPVAQTPDPQVPGVQAPVSADAASQPDIQDTEEELDDDDLELEELISGTTIVKDDDDVYIPKVIKITKNTREKQQEICKQIAKIGGNPYEWYGFLLASKDDPENIVRDVILAQDQDVKGGHCRVAGEQVAAVSGEVEKLNRAKGLNLHVVGWTHSHGAHDTFHSHTDDGNHFQVLNSVSLNTEKSAYKTFGLIESTPSQELLEDRVRIKGKDLEDGAVDFLLKDEQAAKALLKKYNIKVKEGQEPGKLALQLMNDMLNLSNVSTKKPQIAGYAYSIVVNDNNAPPHVELAVLEEDVFSKKKHRYTIDEKQGLSLEVVEVDDDVQFTAEDIAEEVKEKISFPRQRTMVETIGHQVGNVVTKVTNFGRDWEKWVGQWDQNSWQQGGRQEGRYRGGKGRRTIVRKTAKPKKQMPKKVKPEELAKVFAAEAMEYVSEYQYASCEYSKFMDAFLGKIVSGSKRMEDIVKDFGFLEQDTLAYRPEEFSDAVVNLLSKKIISKNLAKKKKKDPKVLGFMLDFVNAETTQKRSKVISKYVPLFMGIDPAVVEFSKRIVDYAKGYGLSGSSYSSNPYRKWTRKVFDILRNSQEGTLETAIMQAGLPQKDIDMDAKFYRQIDDDEKVEISKIITTSEHDEDTVNFMREFVKQTSNKNRVLEAYAAKLLGIESDDKDETEVLLSRGEAIEDAKGSELPVLGEVEHYSDEDAGRIVKSFANSSVVYSQSYSGDYGSWLAYVLHDYCQGKAKSLDEAISLRGLPVSDKEMTTRAGLTEPEIRKLTEKLLTETHNDDVLAFMLSFSNPQTQEGAITSYGQYFVEKGIVSQDDADLDDDLEELLDSTTTQAEPSNEDSNEIVEATLRAVGNGPEEPGRNQNAVVKSFANNFVSYATSYTKSWAGADYGIWANQVMDNLLHRDDSLDEVLLAKGKPLLNGDTAGGYNMFDKGQKETAIEKICALEYDPVSLLIMEKFNATKDLEERDSALIAYVMHVESADEEEELEECLSEEDLIEVGDEAEGDSGLQAKEIVELYAGNIIDYASSKSPKKYTNWMKSMLWAFLDDDSDCDTLEDAIIAVGELHTSKKRVKGLKKKDRDRIVEKLTAIKFNDNVIRSMQEFNDNSLEDRESLLESYVSQILDGPEDDPADEVDSGDVVTEMIITQYADKLIRYATSEKKYSKWVANVLYDFYEDETFSDLQEFLVQNRPPVSNDTFQTQIVFTEDNLSTIKNKILGTGYSEDTKTLMQIFNASDLPDDEAIEKLVEFAAGCLQLDSPGEGDERATIDDEVIGAGSSIEGVVIDGLRGRVVSIHGTEAGDQYGVEWDRAFTSGHECDGVAKEKHGLYVMKENIKKITLPPANLTDEESEELKVGDKVVGEGVYSSVDINGLKGKVVVIDSRLEANPYGIEWEKGVRDGHACSGEAKEGYGLYVPRRHLKKTGQPEQLDLADAPDALDDDEESEVNALLEDCLQNVPENDPNSDDSSTTPDESEIVRTFAEEILTYSSSNGAYSNWMTYVLDYLQKEGYASPEEAIREAGELRQNSNLVSRAVIVDQRKETIKKALISGSYGGDTLKFMKDFCNVSGFHRDRAIRDYVALVFNPDVEVDGDDEIEELLGDIADPDKEIDPVLKDFADNIVDYAASDEKYSDWMCFLLANVPLYNGFDGAMSYTTKIFENVDDGSKTHLGEDTKNIKEGLYAATNDQLTSDFMKGFNENPEQRDELIENYEQGVVWTIYTDFAQNIVEYANSDAEYAKWAGVLLEQFTAAGSYDAADDTGRAELTLDQAILEAGPLRNNKKMVKMKFAQEEAWLIKEWIVNTHQDCSDDTLTRVYEFNMAETEDDMSEVLKDYVAYIIKEQTGDKK